SYDHASISLFLSTEPTTPEIYTLSLHDALPISIVASLLLVLSGCYNYALLTTPGPQPGTRIAAELTDSGAATLASYLGPNVVTRSEEHTSELQSRGHLVCRLLLEKKKSND